jgi:hypothetical protein
MGHVHFSEWFYWKHLKTCGSLGSWDLCVVDWVKIFHLFFAFKTISVRFCQPILPDYKVLSSMERGFFDASTAKKKKGKSQKGNIWHLYWKLRLYPQSSCQKEQIETLIERKGANKSPPSPLYKRGGLMPSPLIKGDRGGFCSITMERSAYFMKCLYMGYERRFVVFQNPYVPAHPSKICRFVSPD